MFTGGNKISEGLNTQQKGWLNAKALHYFIILNVYACLSLMKKPRLHSLTQSCPSGLTIKRGPWENPMRESKRMNLGQMCLHVACGSSHTPSAESARRRRRLFLSRIHYSRVSLHIPALEVEVSGDGQPWCSTPQAQKGPWSRAYQWQIGIAGALILTF